ncbi:MAG: hypothetical protein WC222_08940 [Parachlamydiales bacterium]|jgi:hypothetical protein
MQNFVSEKKKYFIEYPAHWTQVPASLFDISIFAPSKNVKAPSSANMTIVSEGIENSVTLDEVYSDILAQFSKEDPKIQTGESTIGGIASKWTLHTQAMFGLEIKVLQYIIVAQNKKYLIAFSAVPSDFTDFQSEFETIASSFRLNS